MIGCFLAAAGVVGLIKLAHFRRHGYCGSRGGWGGWHHHHHGHGGGCGGYEDLRPQGDTDGMGGLGGRHGLGRHAFGRRGFGRRFILRGIMERLDATPAQERVIVAAADEFREATDKIRGEARKSRADVADAFRKPTFDGVLLGELFARHDTELESLRKAFVGLTAKVHDALDEKQRSRLADMLEAGPRFFRRGPFRDESPRGDFDRPGWGW